MAFARSLTLGGFSGALGASCLAPGGFGPTALAVHPNLSWTGLWIAGGLVIGFSLRNQARRATDLAPAWVAAGAASGFLGHLFFWNEWVVPRGPIGFALILLLGAIAISSAARPPARRESTESERAAQPSFPEGLGLLLAAAGAGLSLAPLLRNTAAQTAGTLDDLRWMACCWLAGIAVSAALFRRLAAGGRSPLAAAIGLVLVPASVAFVLRADSFVVHARGFENLLRRTGFLEPGWIGLGSPGWTALLTLLALGLPALALGLTLAGARRPRRLASIVTGATLGAGTEALLAGLPDWNLPPWLPAIVAGLGAALAVLSAPPIARLAPKGGLLACSLACASVFLWLPASVAPAGTDLDPRPLGVLATGSGAHLEPGQAPLAVREVTEPNGGRFLVCGASTLTPPNAQRELDAACLRLSLSALAVVSSTNAIAERRALLIGLPTEERRAVWQEFPDLIVDHVLFPPPAMQLPGDRSISVAEAAHRIGRSEYDLVVALPIFGSALAFEATRFGTGSTESPTLGPARGASLDPWQLPSSTLGIQWLPASAPHAGLESGTRVLLAVDPGDGLAIGVLHGAVSQQLIGRTEPPRTAKLAAPRRWPDLGRWMGDLARRSERLEDRLRLRLAPDALLAAHADFDNPIWPSLRRRPMGVGLEASAPRY